MRNYLLHGDNHNYAREHIHLYLDHRLPLLLGNKSLQLQPRKFHFSMGHLQNLGSDLCKNMSGH